MFGYKMRVEYEGFGVTLRPYRRDEMPHISQLLESMDISRYTAMNQAPSPEFEFEWYDKVSRSPDTVLWAIEPDGAGCAVGSTGLHKLDPVGGACESGIIIADKSFWGKGVASRAHLARTWYAVNTLNRATIQSHVRCENQASLKALLRVGYFVSGKQVKNWFREGHYMDSLVLSWINPYRTDQLFPEGVPEEYLPYIQKAREALELANKVVKFI